MLTLHPQPWGAGLCAGGAHRQVPQGRARVCPGVTVDLRELPRPNSVLFRPPNRSHVRDGQPGGLERCRALLWPPLGWWWWGLSSVLGLLCQISHLPSACCPSGLGQRPGWGGGRELEGPPREARQQWMASPKLGPGRARGPVGGHRAGREGAPGVGHVCGKGVVPLLQKWDPQPHPGSPFPCLNLHS